jgi:subtilase family serine protease
MGKPLSRRRLLVAGLAIATSTVTVSALAATPVSAAPSRHLINGSAPKWLGKATTLGDSPAQNRVSFGLLLGMRNADKAQALLQSVSDPDNADYGKWLTDAQFNAQFAPSASDVSAVQKWLKGQGFAVDKTLPSGMFVEASGTTAQIEKTFATTVKTYRYQGQTVHSNDNTLSLPSDAPAAVTATVAGVLGVDQGAQIHKKADPEPGPAPGARYGVPPCSAYYGEKVATDKPSAYGKKWPYAVCGYTPNQYQGGYGEAGLVHSGIDGRGVTVAITDAYASPTIYQDAQTYSRRHDVPTFKNGQFSQITPGPNGYNSAGPDQCDAQGWYGEETLDVEAVHGMAPGAKVVYVGAASCNADLDNTWAESIDNHVADIITNSWGSATDDITLLSPQVVQFYQQFSLKAALTGITVNFSSGDAGDETSGGTDPAAKTVDFPADLPLVTGVGGTSVGIGSHNQWLWEHGWQSAYSPLTNGAWTPAPPGNYVSGGGGGTSVLFQQPWYQKGKVPSSISRYWGGAPMRAVPDISMAGDANTGFLVGQTQEFPDGTYYDEYRIGGTSLSSPLLAGVIAVASQFAHRKLGFVNPAYYKLLGTPALHDIVAPNGPFAQVRTVYNNNLDNTKGKGYILQTIDVQSSTIHSKPGYDDETGVGSPNGPLFFLGMAFASRR